MREEGLVTSHVIEQKSFRVPSRPRALWLSRWPVLLSRLGLGWILGRQFMLISHRGRVSGILRQTGVMILRYDRQTRWPAGFELAGSGALLQE